MQDTRYNMLESMRACPISGTPKDITPKIEEIIAAGANHVAFGLPLGPDLDAAPNVLREQVVPYSR